MESRPAEELVFKKYRKTTAGERVQWVRRYLSSGLTHREFCRRYGISTTALAVWQRQLREQQQQTAAARQSELTESKPVLKEVPLASVLGGGRWAGELNFPSGTVLRFVVELSPALLKEIIQGVIC
jgi:transposase-like protein